MMELKDKLEKLEKDIKALVSNQEKFREETKNNKALKKEIKEDIVSLSCLLSWSILLLSFSLTYWSNISELLIWFVLDLSFCNIFIMVFWFCVMMLRFCVMVLMFSAIAVILSSNSFLFLVHDVYFVIKFSF